MEELPVGENIVEKPALFRPRWKATHVYGVIITLLLFITLASSGSFVDSAHASSPGSKVPTGDVIKQANGCKPIKDVAKDDIKEVGKGTANNDGVVDLPALVVGISSTKGDNTSQGAAADGYITAVKGSTLFVKTISENGKISVVKVTDQTKIFNQAANQEAKLSDLKVGDYVTAMGTANSDGSINALGVAVGLPSTKGDNSQQGAEADGYITAVKGSTLFVKTVSENGKISVVKATDQAKIFNQATGQEAKLSDLKVGDYVTVMGTANSDGSIDALGVAVGLPSTKEDNIPPDAGAVGYIKSLNGSTFVIQENGKTSVVKATDQTKFFNQATGQEARPSDLKVGDFVTAKGTANSDGSINALGVAVGVPSAQPQC